MANQPDSKLTIYRFDFCCWDKETYYFPASNDITEPHDSDESAILAAECYLEEKLKHPQIVKASCMVNVLLEKYKLGRHVKTITKEKPPLTLLFPQI